MGIAPQRNQRSSQLIASPSIFLAFILLISFVGKIITRIYLLQGVSLWETGYTLYYQIAHTILGEGRFYSPPDLYDTAIYLAPRTPLYPFLIALVLRAGQYADFYFIGVEALFSTLTVLWVFLIAQKTAGTMSALWAAVLCAFYPYLFFHDTQLQETGIYTCLSTLGVLVLLDAFEKESWVAFFAAGFSAGLAILTRASHVVPALFLIPIIFLNAGVRKVLCAVAFCVGLFLCVSPWLIRNHNMVGAAVLTTETGAALAKAHNPFVFDFYPWNSIDESTVIFQARLPLLLNEEQTQTLRKIHGDEAAQNRWFKQWAMMYMKQHLWQTIGEGMVKAGITFSGILTPLKSTLQNQVYFVSYWVLTGLAFGGWRASRNTLLVKVFFIFCLSHAVFAFIFWSHSSHRSFLDPLLAVMAGIGMQTLVRKDGIHGVGRIHFATPEET